MKKKHKVNPIGQMRSNRNKVLQLKKHKVKFPADHNSRINTKLEEAEKGAWHKNSPHKTKPQRIESIKLF